MKTRTKERLIGFVGLWWFASAALATGDGYGAVADTTRLIAFASLVVATYIGYRLIKTERRKKNEGASHHAHSLGKTNCQAMTAVKH